MNHIPNNQQPTSVVVNDDVTQLNVLSGLLKSQGHNVLSFDSAEKALSAMVCNAQPDLIVTDLYMPGIDGWRFCRLLRSPEYESFNHVPILVVSATFSGEEATRITVDLGANAFLPAPVEGTRFTELVHSLMCGKKPQERLKVLIVEDSRALAILLKKNFESFGYRADFALNGQEAVSRFADVPYDIAIIDYHLPDIQGDQLLVDFQKANPRSVFIMMTSDPLPALSVEWMKLGASAYLRKPFEMEYLMDQCAKARRERALLHVEDLLEKRTRQLQLSEERYRTVVNAQNELVCKWEPDSTLIFVNEAYCRYFGKKPDEVIGRQFIELVPEKSREFVLQRIKNLTDSFQSQTVLQDVISESGDICWLEWIDKPILDEKGCLLELLSVGRDVTERVRLETLIRAERNLGAAWSSANTFKDRLLSCLRAAIQTASMDCGGIYLVNEYSHDLVLTAHQGLSEQFVSQASHYPADSNNAKLIQEGKTIYTPHKDLILKADGAIKTENLKSLAMVPVLFQGRAIACLNVGSHRMTRVPEYSRFALERIAQFIGSFISQELLEEKIRQNRKNLETLFNTIEDMVFILDMDGKIICCNRNVSDRLEYAVDELIDKHVLFVHPVERHPEGQKTIAAIMTGETDSCPIPLQTKSGRLIPVETKVKFGRWQDRDVIFGISRDITERLEIAYRKQQIEKSESLTRMAGAIAHNFNNMLGAVIGNLDLAMEDIQPQARINENISEAKQAALRAAEISGLMLTFLGQVSTKPKPLNLSEFCKIHLEHLLNKLPEKVSLKTTISTPGPFIMADPDQIGQVITNLTTNAWEAMDSNPGVVQIMVETVDAETIMKRNRFPVEWTQKTTVYACLTVSDTGIGMDEDTVGKIFDPFYTNKFTGRGLGLPIVLGIVKSLEGCITVDSMLGRGSTFQVFLPQFQKRHFQPKEDSSPVTSTTTGEETVLIVDDESLVRKVVTAMVERLGYKVIVAKDGAEAVELFKEHQDHIRIVLSDLTMPNMDGWETLEALRRINPDIAVILASGYDEAMAMSGDRAEQPQLFLHKPYEMSALKLALKKALANKDRSQ